MWGSVLSLLFGSPRLVVEPRDAFAEALNAPGSQQGLEGLKAGVLAEGKHKPLTMGDVYDLSVLLSYHCLLYTSDAADEEDSVDLGGRRIIKKKKNEKIKG
eukprot:TRINITY_DN37893_c0_g1_i1.p2 TRINITY_DN37893_c0_g1~~TRINITY_DN37893_c0_g1_i1.p2  ORF type:complete len:101 (-),score=19.32 TRINITY_DN37893_c0_g1_i1:99-401(-)